MLTRTIISRISLIALAGIAVAPAAARQDNERDQGRASRWSTLLNVDLMVNTYSRFLARKYDLNEEQDEFTRQYLAEQANMFMDAHRDEVTDLVDRMFEVRTGGDMDQEELIDWGKRILPIYQEAKKIIVMGNGEWRDILTDEQKAIHDGDLKLMAQSFNSTEDQLHRIVTGEMTVEEFRKPASRRNARRSRAAATKRAKVVQRDPPRQFEETQQVQRLDEWREREVLNRDDPDAREISNRHTDEALARVREAELAARLAEEIEEMDPLESTPARAPKTRKPPRTPRKTPSKNSSRSGGKNFESTWEAHTRQFIEKYQLNDEQAQKANSILRDCQEQGRRHMTKSKSRFEAIDKQLAGLKSSDKKQRSAKMSALNDQQKKLREPIDRIFEKQLKPRLEKLPTRAQRKAAESGSRSSGKSSKKSKNK